MASLRVSGSASGIVLLLVLVIIAIIVFILLPIWALGVVMVVLALVWPRLTPHIRAFLLIAGLLFLLIGLLLAL